MIAGPHQSVRARGLSRALLVICALIAVPAARAQNRGVYPLGMSAFAPGALPDPGFAYANQFLSYSRDQATDAAGRTVAT